MNHRLTVDNSCGNDFELEVFTMPNREWADFFFNFRGSEQHKSFANTEAFFSKYVVMNYLNIDNLLDNSFPFT